MNASHHGQHTGVELTATLRPPETDRGNLFVRLGPQTARHLSSLLTPHDDAGDANRSHDIGSLSHSMHDVDFLPLEIVIFRPGSQAVREIEARGDVRFDGAITLYASYNGGAPASSSGVGAMANENIIELSIDLHPSLQSVFNSTSEPIMASVRPLPNVRIAERVTFEPLAVSDWEMIEMEANVLEDGGLLNQITIVSPGQVFPLRFGGSMGGIESAAWIRVVDEELESMDRSISDDSDATFTSLSDSEFESPSDEGNDSMHGEGDDTCNIPCVRLMAETEVLVVPKPRARTEETVDTESIGCAPEEDPVYCPSGPLRVQPNLSDVQHVGLFAEDLPATSLPNPQLGFVCVHPATLMQLPGYQSCIGIECGVNERKVQGDDLPPIVVTLRKVNSPHATKQSWHEVGDGRETGRDIAVATCLASTCTREGHIGMDPLLRRQLDVAPWSDWISLQVWSESHVTNSILGVRSGTDRIKIAKLCSWTTDEEWGTFSPDSMCKSCTLNHTGNTSPQAPRAPVFSLGSIVPAGFLQSLGLDWLDEHPFSLFCLQRQPNIASTNSSNNKHAGSSTDTSQLAPVVTANDLKNISRSDVIDEDPLNVEMETQTHQLSVPFQNDVTVGFTGAIDDVVRSARQIMSSQRKYTQPVAIMLVGEEGAGKTHLSIAAASRLSMSDLCATVYLDCKKLQASSTNIQSILKEVQAAFQEAAQKQPTVLVLDDLDALIPNVESSSAEGDGSIHHHQLNPALVLQVKIIADHLILQSQQFNRSASDTRLNESSGIIILCTCRDKSSLSTRYQESGVFHSSVEVPSLDSSERAQFFRNKIFGRNASPLRIQHVLSRLGKDTDGFRPKDLALVSTRIVSMGYLHNFHRHTEPNETHEDAEQSSLKMLESHVASILEDYAPLSQQLVDIKHSFSSSDWESIGGLYDAKQSLHDIIIHPMRFKAVYDNVPMTLPTGVLLYGPPGNGKSFIVPLLAKKCKLNLITCRGPELLDRYIGASEAKVRQLFARAAAAAPAMLFFDEFDSLAPQVRFCLSIPVNNNL